jgi:hypothetical protein
MTTSTTTTTLAAGTGSSAGAARTGAHRRLVRAGSVAAAAAATGAIFAAGRAAGTDFTITDPGQHAVPHTFVLPEIVIVTLVIGLAGWLTLAFLERVTSRAQLVWSTLATVTVLLSLVPIWIEKASTDTRILLAVIHIAVGLVLIPMARTASRRV